MEPVVVGVIVFLILLAINLGFNIPARIKGYFYSDKLIIIFSCIQNLLVGILVMCIDGVIQTAENHIEIGYVLGMVFFFPISIGSNVIIVGCCKEKNKTRKMFLSFSSRIKGRPNEAQNYIERAHANPPILKIRGKYSRHTSLSYVDYVPYQSWQEISSDDNIYDTDAKVVILKFKTEYNLSENLEQEMQNREAILEKMSNVLGFHIFQKRGNRIYNIKKTAVFTTGLCMFKFLQNGCGILLYMLIHIFGFSTVFENYIGCICKGYTINITRRISDSNDLPNAAYKPDNKYQGGEECTMKPIPSIPQVLALHSNLHTLFPFVEGNSSSSTFSLDDQKSKELFKSYEDLIPQMIQNNPTLPTTTLQLSMGFHPSLPPQQIFAIQQQMFGQQASLMQVNPFQQQMITNPQMISHQSLLNQQLIIDQSQIIPGTQVNGMVFQNYTGADQNPYANQNEII